MQRCVLKLNVDEYRELIGILDIGLFAGTPLYEKFRSASENINTEIEIFLSEDEIERILDEVGPPIAENQVLNNALKKISNLLVSFRS